jgi:hypothetical protein
MPALSLARGRGLGMVLARESWPRAVAEGCRATLGGLLGDSMASASLPSPSLWGRACSLAVPAPSFPEGGSAQRDKQMICSLFLGKRLVMLPGLAWDSQSSLSLSLPGRRDYRCAQPCPVMCSTSGFII